MGFHEGDLFPQFPRGKLLGPDLGRGYFKYGGLFLQSNPITKYFKVKFPKFPYRERAFREHTEKMKIELT